MVKVLAGGPRSPASIRAGICCAVTFNHFASRLATACIWGIHLIPAPRTGSASPVAPLAARRSAPGPAQESARYLPRYRKISTTRPQKTDPSAMDSMRNCKCFRRMTGCISGKISRPSTSILEA